MDDSQIYLPLKRNDNSTLIPLLECLKEKNEDKIEVTVIGPGQACEEPPMDLGSLQPYAKPIVTNLCMKMHMDFKIQKQKNAMIRPTFYSSYSAPF